MAFEDSIFFGIQLHLDNANIRKNPNVKCHQKMLSTALESTFDVLLVKIDCLAFPQVTFSN
jgi:hypothetical protein